MKISLFLRLSVIAGLFACTSVQKTTQEKEPGIMPALNQIVAHRGAFKTQKFPENSIAALKHAFELKCGGTEFDIHMTADDSLIINHDPHYQKLQIEKTNYADLIKTPLSNGEKLPTLREFIQTSLQYNQGSLMVYEIKPSSISKERGRLVAERVLQLIRQMKATKNALFISFDIGILQRIKELDPKAHVQYLNGEKSPAELKAAGMDGADYHFSVFKKHPEWIESAKALKLALNAWTVNDAADMDWLLAQGFQYITTNEPELLAERIKLAPTSGNWKLVWHDEFNYEGLPNAEKWNYDVGGHGWGNNEWQYYTREDTNNAVVRHGHLYITARKQTKENSKYTSARLITKGKGDWLYGRIEVRAKLPAGRGTWPAIWMLPSENAYGTWPASGEIDIMENVGYNPDTIYSSVHTRSFNHMIGTQKTNGKWIKDPSADFHIYTAEWTDKKIDFFIDDKLFFSFANTGKGFAEWPFDKKFHLLLNIAIGGNWGGHRGVADDLHTAVMEVDYVRVFQK